MELISIENNTDPKNILSIQKINNNINRKKPVVIYFYMDECPYCIKTTDEWNQIPNHINREILDDELLTIRINQLLFNNLNNVGEKPRSYPTIRYINGNTITQYDKEGEYRTAQDLAKWIEDKQTKIVSDIRPTTSHKPTTYVEEIVLPMKKSSRRKSSKRKSSRRKSSRRRSTRRKSSRRRSTNL
jgi:thiol-disulfide isomerase/thioredoxin